MDEEIDEVKKMNHYVMQSEIYRIREAQLKEERELEQDFLNEEKALNTMMEIERLKAVIY